MSTMSDSPHTSPYTSPTLSGRQITCLERLGLELRDRGLSARLSTSAEHPPRLHVLNPELSTLSEDIRAEFTLDGWYFVWSWAERMCPVDDVTGAAEMVTRVLDA